MVLILGHFGKQTRNTWEVLKCGAGELWGRSIELTVLRRKNYYIEVRNIVHTTKGRKANWIGHILRRNYVPKHVIEENIERKIKMAGRRGRRRKQLLYGLKENRGRWKLKEERSDRTVWRICFFELMDLS